ncbi:aconitate hydratase AcnA [Candidatus Odyssella acanthamoebae]|uniref:Aconitate hydratase n=1 Tax=Candidatus Odyssella acanthamoebae TaxID=91604 RepID=A0A077AVU8_9PROT|nr:aconitate hydratase AcnA [Candidatus Paracaedibacter acanthamoebae]AIK96174.1 aconitate hydratase [Candidatus Paracaedibacter acanthamoebae]
MTNGLDSLKTKSTLKVGDKTYAYFSLEAAEKAGISSISKLPYTIKVLIENLLRHENGKNVTISDIRSSAQLPSEGKSFGEIAFSPARVLMQDFTGVPAVVDLAAMRDAMQTLGGDPEKINPLIPVDLVIDHSVMVDYYANSSAFNQNVELEYTRNAERYKFLKWGQTAFKNFRVVPPGTGICHQVNLEYLSQVVWTKEMENGESLAYPDTLVGTDSHTTMVNGLAVLGWGVGGIEAEAAMLGQPLSMLLPKVVGFKLTGKLADGITATDLVLTVTNILRAKGVVGKFVEFYGPGLDHLSLADRATIANMAPEYGATCGFFPVDKETLRYLEFTGREADRIALVEAYAKAQGLWRDSNSPDPVYDEFVELDLSTVLPTIAGPKRPQDKVLLSDAKESCLATLKADNKLDAPGAAVEGKDYELNHGDVVIAAITSCTNTSNPSVMLGAGLVARKAHALGLKPKPWVKTSLAPGSQVVSDYLEKSGLMRDLEAVGFHLVGYGCTTCIGNSGPLNPQLAKAVEAVDLSVAGVLSGNRNFEGRINPHVKLNYLASPPLVVAYALAGSMKIDLTKDPIGTSKDGKPVYLKDIWPSQAEIAEAVTNSMTPEMFRQRYSNVFKGDDHWQAIDATASQTFNWEGSSTYVKNPPYFDDIKDDKRTVSNISGAKVLALLGDSVTTDHISPAGSIKKDGPAGKYLESHSVEAHDFNSYGSRRGNHEVMMRGTFANIRLANEMVPEKTGGVTRMDVQGEVMSIYDAAMAYQKQGTPLIVIAGKEYGTGSSRDWAAKGTRLLGVKAVIAESFERIHRSNLVGMGVLPLQFAEGVNRKTLMLTGFEAISLLGLEKGLAPGMSVTCEITRLNGEKITLALKCRIDTQDEVDYFYNGGILPYVLRALAEVA